MRFQLGFSGIQVVAIEIDACRARRIGLVSEFRLIEVVRLVGHIGRNRVHFAVDQILRIMAVLNLHHAVDRHALQLQVSQQLVGLRLDHRPHPDQIVYRLRLLLVASDHHQRRMLEDHRQYHDRLAGIARQQQAAVAHPVFRLSGNRFGQRVGSWQSFLDVHLQPGLAVIAQFLCSVVAGELECVCPFEL